MGSYGVLWGSVGSQSHRIAQIGKDLKGHWVQLQPHCSALTMGSCGVVWGPVGMHRMCGALWGCMGSLWGCGGPCGDVWGPMRLYGMYCGCMGSYGHVWDPIGSQPHRIAQVGSDLKSH